jgi:hypothetical protein
MLTAMRRASSRVSRRTSREVFADAVLALVGLGHTRVSLFLITQQFSSRVPDLQAVPVDDVIIWAQGFGGLKRRFEG